MKEWGRHQTSSAAMQHKRGSRPGTSRVAIRRLSMYLCVGLKQLTKCHINHKWQGKLQRSFEMTGTSEWTKGSGGDLA